MLDMPRGTVIAFPAALPPARWCRHCDEPVTADMTTGRAVHSGSGEEKCADGQHVAAPIAADPVMREAAKRISGDYPGWRVAADGSRLKAWSCEHPTPVAIEATSEDEMRARLDAARRPG